MKKYRMCMIPAYPLENVQILKDRVILPYVCYRQFGESLTLITKPAGDYPYLTYLPGANLVFLPAEEAHMEAAIRYVAAHYNEIDLLFLFSSRGSYADLARTYKSLRPDGIIYLKLDANIDWANALPLSHKPFANFLRDCDIISCEARRLQAFFVQKMAAARGVYPKRRLPAPLPGSGRCPL